MRENTIDLSGNYQQMFKNYLELKFQAFTVFYQCVKTPCRYRHNFWMNSFSFELAEVGPSINQGMAMTWSSCGQINGRGAL
jgi:hypothetical protein